MIQLRLALGFLFLCAASFLFLFQLWDHKSHRKSPIQLQYWSTGKLVNFNRFDNVSGVGTGCYIVPNYVHFLRFGQPNFSFVDAVCTLAAFKNQKPEKIFFHTDSPAFYGKYWQVLLDTNGFRDVLVIKYAKMPRSIFGQTFHSSWSKFHGGDITRLKILMRYGGIFLDNDSYIVKSLDDLRRFEMSLGWKEGGNIANQVIVAHKNARFLRLWLETYRDYNPSSWYFNAGIKPTQEILLKRPELVHRLPSMLAAHGDIVRKIFMQKWDGWRLQYALHLLIRHQYLLKNVTGVAVYPVKFNEENIKMYNITFRDMVYDVYPIGK